MIKFLQLFPVILLLIIEPFSFVYNNISSFIHIFSLIYMLSYILISKKINYNLIFLFVLLLLSFIYPFFISYNYIAATESLIRYITPIVVLLYSYSIRFSFNMLLKFFILYTLLSFGYQIIIYLSIYYGVDNFWFFNEVRRGVYSSNTVFGILRATGLLGFFDIYGFLNLIMFFLIHYFYIGKYKNILLIITFLAVIFSISFKLIFCFLIFCFLIKKYRLKVLLVSSSLIIIGQVYFINLSDELISQISKRSELYITSANSARAESYVVMINELKNLNFFGKGLATFGGPASTKYNSPYYDEVNFDWHGLELATTDTYYPHLFVEIGLLPSLLYLFIILFPLFNFKLKIKKIKILLIIYFTLLFTSIFTFALNDIIYMIFSLLLIYPIINSCDKKKYELL